MKKGQPLRSNSIFNNRTDNAARQRENIYLMQTGHVAIYLHIDLLMQRCTVNYIDKYDGRCVENNDFPL